MKRTATRFQRNDGPNRNGSHEDHVMASKALPSQEVLRQLLRYDPETGKLFWVLMEFSALDAKSANASKALTAYTIKNAGKEAFTCQDAKGYFRGKVLGQLFQAHRVIWKLVYGEDPVQVDHINGDTSDNRLQNLRSCTNAQNSRNYPKANTGSSQYRGVCWVKRDRKWAARISSGHGGKISLGNYDDEISAANAYDAAAREMHGEFATLNFPGGQ